ncbi:hypothetical protein K402DRAFT_347437 [Aulographum hederae CBS 113979]|uniref:Uncharacterized protein n=1 Tax=Aulographum hederae CBS 113979 TaxID=1176131 RepID=A0A6G1HC00_9PEZI|nr:hypothetical protein K402DRAFT_347437 [Aulographum hederae CBS 113979]
MATQENAHPQSPSQTLFHQVDQYNWDQDEDFQAGLSAILGSNASPDQAAELGLRARCFFYSRKFNTNVDFDQYKAWREENGATSPVTNGSRPIQSVTALQPPSQPQASGGAEPAAPYPTSFAQIVELITTGKPVPGIKDIPDTVLEGQGTEATKPKRRKPWEKEEAPAPEPQSTS